MRYLLTAIVLLMVGCTAESVPPPPWPILMPGTEAMASNDNPQGSVMVWASDGVAKIPQGSTVRVIDDPGPDTTPDRSVRIHAVANGVTGEVSRGELTPIPVR